MKPSGDQPKAIEALVSGISKKLSHQTLLGVTGSGKTYTIANIISQTNKTTLVLAPNKTLAAQLYAEMREFFPNNSVEYFVSYYDYYQPEAYVPVSDTFIEKDASLNEHIEQMRLSATKSLTERKDAIVVGTVWLPEEIISVISSTRLVSSLLLGSIVKANCALASVYS